MYKRQEEWWNIERALVNPPQFVNEEDLSILRALWADRLHETVGLRAFGLGPRHGAQVLERLARSGRLYVDSGDGLPLSEGGTRPARVGWRAVSYTHLDVYKRQLRPRSPRFTSPG